MAGVKGAAADRTVGRAPTDLKVKPDPVEKEHVLDKSRANGSTKDIPAAPEGADPLDGLLWGHEMVDAFEARALETGDKVRVGILDTGVDGDHLDIAPNFDAALSRNFATDIPAVDGDCEFAGCLDPADHDDNGHGTHVAGTIGAALNGVGISGIAPDADARQHPRRPGQRLLLPQPGRRRPHLRGQQRPRRRQHVLLRRPVAVQLPGRCARGPEVPGGGRRAEPHHRRHDPGAWATRRLTASRSSAPSATTTRTSRSPRTDFSSPDYDNPLYTWDTAPWERTIDNAKCFDLPVEGPNVIGVSALGPSEREGGLLELHDRPHLR